MQIHAVVLLDRFGSKKYLLALLYCVVFDNVIFVSGGYELALFGKLLVRLGSSFAFIVIIKLTLENFESKYFQIITSLVISLSTLAAAVFSQNISIIISHYSVFLEKYFCNRFNDKKLYNNHSFFIWHIFCLTSFSLVLLK
ncbi:hypothetical protein FSC845_02960 [Francisella persica ATCC VR-331]|nr:hypothetical protein FSC845_02960 [Francisella persica ATCC VR-331]